MNPFPPPLPTPDKKDTEHLRLLAVFHFVMAGFTLLGLGFLALHYWVMRTVFTHPDMWKDSPKGPPPEVLLDVLKWFYVGMGVVFILGGIANLLSGIFITRRVNRLFSLIVAGLNCPQFPFGTALGIFSFVVLCRDSIRARYEAGDGERMSLGGMR